LEIDFKAETAIRVCRFRGRSCSGKRDRAPEIAIAIGRTKALSQLRPFGSNPAAAHGAAIEQRPWFTIGVDRPIADNACIAKKQAFISYSG